MSPKLRQIATATGPGTCGELAQGPWEGREVMITCPVALHATARVMLCPGHGRLHTPADAPRTRSALEALPPAAEQDLWLELDNPLPRGRGMASSTADLCTALAARLALEGRHLSARELARRVLAVEPSDGIMLPGIALFDHREGTVMESLAEAPPLWVLCLDFGGRVDTLRFNAHPPEPHDPQAADAVAEVHAGLRENDLKKIAAGATASALARQSRLPHPALDEVRRLAEKTGAMGLNRAHSGTVLGLLFDDPERAEDAGKRILAKALPGLGEAHCLALTRGGVTVRLAEDANHTDPVRSWMNVPTG